MSTSAQSLSSPSWSTFWQQEGGLDGTDNVQYVQKFSRDASYRLASFALSRPGMRGVRKAMYALLGAATGSSKASSHTRVLAPDAINFPSQLGGLIAMETFNDSTGNTSATDLTYFQNQLNNLFSADPSFPYPVDASGATYRTAGLAGF